MAYGARVGFRIMYIDAFSPLPSSSFIQCLVHCNGDVSYDEGSLQKVRTVTMTMTDVECLRLI